MLLVTVSTLAAFMDIVPVFVAATLSAVIWDFVFVPPAFALGVGSGDDLVLLITYFLLVVVNVVLTHKIRRIKKVIDEKEGHEKTAKLYNAILNSLSHELRTPITAILAATDILQGNADKLSGSDRAYLIDEISLASVRLNQQVENILSLSRLESGTFAVKTDWFDINDLVYKTIQVLESNLSKHTVIVKIPEPFPLFKVDFGLLRQVLHNLIINATQHTPKHSKIIIEAAHTENTLLLVVSDNGNGFPGQELKKVFDKFYRLKGAPTGGTGLGLSIVKGFVEAHHGTVKLENIPGGGAKFTIEIQAEKSLFNH